jgi:hypothetical protein
MRVEHEHRHRIELPTPEQVKRIVAALPEVAAARQAAPAQLPAVEVVEGEWTELP